MFTRFKTAFLKETRVPREIFKQNCGFITFLDHFWVQQSRQRGTHLIPYFLVFLNTLVLFGTYHFCTLFYFWNLTSNLFNWISWIDLTDSVELTRINLCSVKSMQLNQMRRLIWVNWFDSTKKLIEFFRLKQSSLFSLDHLIWFNWIIWVDWSDSDLFNLLFKWILQKSSVYKHSTCWNRSKLLQQKKQQ